MSDEMLTFEQLMEILGFDSEQEWVEEANRQKDELSKLPILPDISGLGDGTGIEHPESPEGDEAVDCNQAINNINALRSWIAEAKAILTQLDDFINNPSLNALRTDSGRYYHRYKEYESIDDDPNTIDNDISTDFEDIFNDINDRLEQARFRAEIVQELWYVESTLLHAWEDHYNHYCANATSDNSSED